MAWLFLVRQLTGHGKHPAASEATVERAGYDRKRRQQVNSRMYLVGVLVVVLLIWGPLDNSRLAWVAIRIAYLILAPVAAWFVLKWIWKVWQPDAATETRFERALAGAIAGVLVVLAVLAATEKTHIGNTKWVRTRDGMEAVGEDIVLPGPDWQVVLALAAFAVVAFTLSVAKRKDGEAGEKMPRSPAQQHVSIADDADAIAKAYDTLAKGELEAALPEAIGDSANDEQLSNRGRTNPKISGESRVGASEGEEDTGVLF